MEPFNDAKKKLDLLIANIRKLRELRSFTREAFAAEIGLSSSGYSKIERGEIELSVLRLFAIADILHVEIAQLLNLDVQAILNNGNEIAHGSSISEGQKVLPFDFYRDKYILMLEEENRRLKSVLAKHQPEP